MGDLRMVVEIEKIVHGGYGLARLNSGVCFVPFTVPGDVLDVECTTSGGGGVGWIKRIVRSSPHRKRAKCPVFTVCGGCDFQHMSYSYELEVKRQILVEDLARIAGISETNGIEIIHNSDYGYRNHAQVKVDEEGRIGFYEKKSHQVVQLPEKGCRLLHEKINRYILKIRKEKVFQKGGFRVRSDAHGNIYKKGIPGVADDRYCCHSISGLNFRINIDDFFQVNNFLIERWLSRIKEYLEIDKYDRIADVYCGSGAISLFLAKYVKSIIGIELNKNAVWSARYNAEWNNILNVTFVRSRADVGVRSLTDIQKIIIDPSRSGLGNELIEGIVRLQPRVIVYASCDTATFSRDIREFSENGYLLQKVSLVDMFPRTKHIEVVSRLISSPT